MCGVSVRNEISEYPRIEPFAFPSIPHRARTPGTPRSAPAHVLPRARVHAWPCVLTCSPLTRAYRVRARMRDPRSTVLASMPAHARVRACLRGVRAAPRCRPHARAVRASRMRSRAPLLCLSHPLTPWPALHNFPNPSISPTPSHHLSIQT